ncbi:questin oxidase family protein [Saccharothrix deserti]|uniref:questin oxidase family protein n=1 Tax=Saccharothrix deserti TaxID=2593674 RepID=UPI00131E5B88|nr:questin oxidase family protein [Saccharothrix deserti]
MSLEADGVLDEMYERLHRTGPEFDGWLSNHGPMAVEAMIRAGYASDTSRWLDWYVRRLDELPVSSDPVVLDRTESWRGALGDERRVGDWIELFTRELANRPWRDVLATWWPRLLPGIVAGATHGVIRVGHAVRVLLTEDTTPPRIAELAHGLGYWAARWQQVPGVVGPAGTAAAPEALAGVPRVGEQTGGIGSRIAQLGTLDGWSSALAALRVPVAPEDARSLLAGLVDTAVLRYRTHGHGSGVMLVHAATAPNAVLRTLPALPPDLWGTSLAAAWAASAAVSSAYAPPAAAPESALPTAPEGPDAAADVLARAVEHGDEHAVKFADTAVETFERTNDPAALSAAIRATRLIQPAA